VISIHKSSLLQIEIEILETRIFELLSEEESLKKSLKYFSKKSGKAFISRVSNFMHQDNASDFEKLFESSRASHCFQVQFVDGIFIVPFNISEVHFELSHIYFFGYVPKEVSKEQFMVSVAQHALEWNSSLNVLKQNLLREQNLEKKIS
jgi:hypothetical protein